MGNNISQTKYKIEKKDSNEENEDEDGFYLEGWEILDKDKKNENTYNNKLAFTSDLIISQVKKDPFQDYEEIKQLGIGSFAKVKLVQHNLTGAIRAMKIINKKENILSFNNDIEILNEIYILKKMDHPNIVKIFEFYNSEDTYYLITEYCEGGELFDLITEHKKFTEEQCAYIMHQLFSAINYCHKMKIMHRDLKPENILISKKEKQYHRIKICDFGTSQVFKKGDIQSKPVGSIYYVAPEVIQKRYNSKCDLWSCGVIMFMLLTGKAPFGGFNESEIINNILIGKYNTEFLKDLSPNCSDLIGKLLEKDFKKRINAENALKHDFFKEYKTKELLNEIKDEKIIERFMSNLKNYNCQSILQEAALAYLVHNYPDLEDITNACKLFNIIDVLGDGKITLEDLYNGMNNYIKSETLREDIVEIFSKLDKNNDNYLGCEEFVRAAIDKSIFISENVLKFAFKYFDKENKGEVTIEEIVSLFQDQIEAKDAEENLKKIISEVSKEEKRKIEYSVFCEIMKKILK